MIKKIFFSSLMVVLTGFIFAQANFSKPNRQIFSKNSFNNQLVNKSTGCTDIIQYPQSKTSNILLDTMDYITYIGAIGQTYYFTGNGLVHGINVYMTLDLDGIPGNKDSVSMVISVRNINGGNVPTTVMGSDTVFLHDVGFTTQNLMFSSPIAVTDSFAVVIEIDTLNPSNPYYATNDYGDGAAEQLSSLAYTGILYNLYPTWSGTWDVDMMLSPIFEQEIIADYFVDTNSVCIGNPITFTNNSSVDYNTMFNMGKETYWLELGDLNNTFLDTNYTHFYTAIGTYATELTATTYGYTGNCSHTSNLSVTVLDTASANFNFNHLGSGTFQFSDLSTNAISWAWDFGDSSAVHTQQSPVYTYSTPGNYQVCLTVQDSNGCNTSTFCQSVSFAVGQKENVVSNDIKIYPIPAKRFFTVELPTTFFEPTIVVTDIVGKKIILIDDVQQNKVKVLTDELNSGVYFVSVSSNGQKVFTKRIVVDK
jgi:PKD repeat protein